MSEDKAVETKAEENTEADAKESKVKATESNSKSEEMMNGEVSNEETKDVETKEEVTTKKEDETKKGEKSETSKNDEKAEEKDVSAKAENGDSTSEKKAEKKETEIKEEDTKEKDEEKATDDKEETKEVKDVEEHESKEDVNEEAKDETEAEDKEEDKEEVEKESESSAKASEASPSKTPRSGRKNKRTSLDSLFDDSIQIPTALKRERKQVGNYAPENFKGETTPPKKFTSKVGRGQKLRELSSVKDSIARTAAKDPILTAAYKLVFGGTRGRSSVSKKHIKSRLLDFNGYLEVPPEDADKATIEQLDTDVESKMATRAYKMTVPLLKSLCDLFDVDRIPAEGKTVIDKDTLIDRLLDFLGAPDSKYLKTPKKKATPKKRKAPAKTKSPTPKKKKVRKEVGKKAKAEQRVYQDESETEDEMDVDSEEESEEEVAKMPSDKMLRKWVRAYVNCFNLDKATTKHAIETASDRFGVDLTGKKARIKELLTEEMS